MNKLRKSLYDISWKTDEETYRADKAYSYSTLAKFEREGFSKLSTLFDRVETPSLTLGSAVDAIITGGQQEFDERFVVAEFPTIPDSIITIVKRLFDMYRDTFRSINDVPDESIINLTEIVKYQGNWKPETRAKVIKEKGAEYYKLLFLSQDKTILSTDTYKDVCNMVDALKNGSTKWYFEANNPFDDIERLYQLKFKATFRGIDYRCMMDLVICDHKNRILYPIDLKTSHKPEYDFPKSFMEWMYMIQNRLYYRILEDNIKKDDYFKNFTIANYKDIVVNKDTLNPMVWVFEHTKDEGTLYITLSDGTHKELRDPFDIAEELDYYLCSNPKVPFGMNKSENSIESFMNIKSVLEEYGQ